MIAGLREAFPVAAEERECAGEKGVQIGNELCEREVGGKLEDGFAQFDEKALDVALLIGEGGELDLEELLSVGEVAYLGGHAVECEGEELRVVCVEA